MAPLSLASAGSSPHASTSYGADSLPQPRFKSKRSACIGAAWCLAALGLLYHSFGQDARLDCPWTVCTSPAHGGGRAICRSSPSPPPVDALQTYITRALRPGAVTSVFVKGEQPVASDDNVYRMPGLNYKAALSGSTRLHRLPMLSEYRDEELGFRFPSNPSIAPDHTRPGSFLLSTQIASGWHVRGPGRARYYPGGHEWRVRNVWGRLQLTETVLGRFEPQVTTIGVDDVFSAIDMRMMEVGNRTLAYGGQAGAGSILIESITEGGSLGHNRVSGPHYMRYTDPSGHENKNWQAVKVGQDIFWMAHFSPLTILDCGVHGPSDSQGACTDHAYHGMTGSLLPLEAVHWRGSHAFLPVPAFPQYLISTTHTRSDVKRDQMEPFRDFYTHHFVLLEADTLMPFAFSTPFTLMANTSSTDWFEFITGAAFFGSCDIILTFGFNDQEPWLATLELGPIMASLLPTFETGRSSLSALQQGFSRENNC
jgi:hypothetical protein